VNENSFSHEKRYGQLGNGPFDGQFTQALAYQTSQQKKLLVPSNRTGLCGALN